MDASPPTPPAPLDLSTCDREPIHIPGAIQPHGFLIALRADTRTVSHASENTERFLAQPAHALLRRSVDELFPPPVVATLREPEQNPLFSQRPLFLAYAQTPAAPSSGRYALLAHQHGGYVILEGESVEAHGAPNPRPGVHHELDAVLAGMEAVSDLRSLLQIAAEEAQRITGFDRVMIYQFDSEWNGNVVAEVHNTRFPSYLGLRFPASDIPRQARELYRRNRLRLIARAHYDPVNLVADPRETAPLDLSLSTLRSVSPIHREYMANMGMESSMSVSLICGGQLWGLISCHGRDPKIVPFDVRATCELLGQVLSLQIVSREHAATLSRRNRLNGILSRLIAEMSRHQDVIQGLRAQSADLLELAGATGAAVLLNDRIQRFGRTPTEDQIAALASWLAQEANDDVLAFDRLGATHPDAAAYSDVASGLLAVSLSRVHRHFVLWFRPEVIATVTWGGNPAKPVQPQPDEPSRLHPRKSFEAWTEIVRGRSSPWDEAELHAAADLRIGILDIVLQQAERHAALVDELMRANQELETISYTISHDLRAPLRAMYGYADSLRDDAADRLNADELRRVEKISHAAHHLDDMIRDVLRYGHVSRIEVNLQPVDLDAFVRKLLRETPALQTSRANTRIEGDLPAVQADAELLDYALSALLENAVKFVARDTPSVVTLRAERRASRIRLWIEDNGIGIKPEHQSRIFDVFQRVHPDALYAGNGVGLAIAKRAIFRMRGDIDVESKDQLGSRFWIELPAA